MFPQNVVSPQTGNGFDTSAVIAQNTGLLGNSPIQNQSGVGMPSADPGLFNSTAPQSSTGNTAVGNMIKALKGSV